MNIFGQPNHFLAKNAVIRPGSDKKRCIIVQQIRGDTACFAVSVLKFSCFVTAGRFQVFANLWTSSEKDEGEERRWVAERERERESRGE